MTKFQRNFLIIAAILALILGVAMAIQLVKKDEQAEVDMTFFNHFKVDLEDAEGREYHIYKIDGILHGGIGHKLTKSELKQFNLGDPLTDEQIDTWFEHDFQIVMRGVAKYFDDFNDYSLPVKLAIGNWLYQLGADAPLKFPRATAAIIARDWKNAADNWVYASTRTWRHSKWYRETRRRCEQEANRLYKEAEKEKQAEESNEL